MDRGCRHDKRIVGLELDLECGCVTVNMDDRPHRAGLDPTVTIGERPDDPHKIVFPHGPTLWCLCWRRIG
jgi:hypothetical protein